MGKNVKTFRNIWEIYHLSSQTEVDSFISKLGYRYLDKIENYILYGVENEVLMVEIDYRQPKTISFNSLIKQIYNHYINYAQENFGFKIVFEETESQTNLMRLDNNECTLFCM